MTLSTGSRDSAQIPDTYALGQAPRVIYVDADSDLPSLLDAVQEEAAPAILVLQDNARPLRGSVSARLLQRRAAAAGVKLAVVTADRVTMAQLAAVGLHSAATVGEARRLLYATPMVEAEPELPPFYLDDEPAARSAAEMKMVDPQGARTAAMPSPGGADRFVAAEDEEAPPVAQVRITRVVSQNKSAPSTIRRLVAWLFTLVLLAAIGVGAWGFFFPQATITISYAVSVFDHTYTILAGGGSPVPVYSTHLTVSGSESVPASGQVQVPFGRAAGTVTLANPLDGVVRVPAGTVLLTAGGTPFATDADVAVPGAVHSFSGSTNGVETVQVTAVQPGPAGNVPAGAIAQLQGRLAGALLVTNYASMSGGTLRTVYHVTARDIAAAATVLGARLQAEATRDLAARYARSPARVITGDDVSPPSTVDVTKSGRLYAQVSLTVRASLEYLHQDDIQRYAASHQQIDVSAQNLTVVPGTQKQSIHVTRVGGHFSISVREYARVVPLIDQTNLRGLLAGHTLAEAKVLLDGSAQFGHWTYTIVTSPNWAGRMPQTTALIRISLKQAHP